MQLVIMAAGMGSRFGGLKQMEPMDEFNNFLLDYSIYDAKRAGFDSVVFIIKKDFYEDFKNTIGKRAEKIIKVEYAFQDLNDLPEGFKFIQKTTVKYNSRLAPHFMDILGESKFICYQVLEDIIFQIFLSPYRLDYLYIELNGQYP